MSPEQAPEPLTTEERAFWLAFIRALLIVPRALDADLTAGQQLSMSEYAALMHLSEAAAGQLRMSELAARCALSLSGITRIVARLGADGYVRRVRADDDARGAFAVLTPAGLARLEAAYPEHLASVRRHVLDHLDGVDLQALTAALERFGSTAQGQPCTIPESESCDLPARESCDPPPSGATDPLSGGA